MEKWRVIPGWEQYEMSERGRVRSLHKNRKGHLMSVYIRDGYPTVILSKNGVWKHQHIHRLLALAWLPNPKNKPFVIHLDCDRSNFHLDNLRWATSKELCQFRKSAKHIRNIISQVRSDYSPNLLAQLNETFVVTRNRIVA